ncbi:MAG: 2-oxoglutarate and iron-dependent oxygenase domain-containing protein [Steroidobacteraceae bacterium]
MDAGLPSLSLRAVDSGPFAQSIGGAYERFGFVIVEDHGIEQPLLHEFLAIYRRFFALPETVKRRYCVPGGGGARGYTPFGIETAKGATHHDLKEFWHVGRELPAGHRYRRCMPENLWVEEIAGFRAVTLRVFAAFDAIGRRLLRAIARHLALAPEFFEDKVNEGNSVLRIIHYPPVTGAPPNRRAGAHEDINVITLLLGAEEPGLEIRDRDGRWLAVNPAPGSLVCNVGDMLQRLTNHMLVSTTHRVANPEPERARHARFSMPFFLHFNPDYLIRTLPGCVTPARPDRYPTPITADEYLLERLREIKLL